MELNIHKKTPSFIIIIFLAFATLAVYWQIQVHEFVNFDDQTYITENLHVQNGLTYKGVIWAFTSNHANFWHPLTWLSHMLDCNIYGLNPSGHHRTNLLLHIANTILLFLALKSLTGTLWRSAFVATLFALHPLHVESVAWASERKDVLSTLFWMLTMWTYARYVKRPGINRYLIVLLFLTLGLMSKPMLVTLPFVMLLLDYWPLGRVVVASHGVRNTVIHLIREKIPFFVLAAAFSIVAFLAQKSGGTVASLESFSLKERTTNALFSLASYIGKMIWPRHLAAFYPHPGDSLSWWQYIGAGSLLVCISLLIFWKSRRLPYLLMGWLWYLGTIVPVIGIVQVGSHGMADRYTYVPLIGLFIIIAWGVPDILAKLRYQRIVLSVSGGIIISSLMILTWFQVQHWRNSTTLFQHAIDVTTNNSLTHNNYGNALARKGKYDEAIFHYEEAIRINPHYETAQYNLAKALAVQGEYNEAIVHYKNALRINPEYAAAHNNLGVTLVQEEKPDEAAFHFNEALRINPDSAEFHNNLQNVLISLNNANKHYNKGLILSSQGRINDAITEYRKALQINPDYAEAHNDMGIALAKNEKIEDAFVHFYKAVQIKPDYAQAHFNIGRTLMGQNKLSEAIEHFSEALRINSNYVEAYVNLGTAFLNQGKFDEAVANFSEAIHIKPDYAKAHNNLGIALAQKGDLNEAIKHFSEALQISPVFEEARTNLELALKEAGKDNKSTPVGPPEQRSRASR